MSTPPSRSSRTQATVFASAAVGLVFFLFHKRRGNGRRGRNFNQQSTLVTFEVGGSDFKLRRSSIDRYPNSRLCEMATKAALATPNPTLQIDREPDLFPWIIQIYNGDDFQSSIPDVCSERLVSELAYYRLPSLADLGIQIPINVISFEESGRRWYDKVLYEIKVCEIDEYFSWYVYIYSRIENGNDISEQSVLVLPGEWDDDASFIYNRGHYDFYSALNAEHTDCMWSRESSEVVSLRPLGRDVQFLITEACPYILLLLNSVAQKDGLEFSCQPMKYRTPDDEHLDLKVFELTYTD